MQKRGVSTIVATVLIILITVAAVTVLWASIHPLINKAMFTEDVNLQIKIDGDASYTTYDSTNGFLSVRIKRGSDKANVVALKFVIDIDGNSISHKRYIVPKPNTAKIYYFGVGFIERISSVKVVPIYYVNGEEVEGQYFVVREKISTNDGGLEDLIDNEDIACASEESQGLSNDLVLYYDFEKIYNTNQLFDLSCRGHTGTLQGAANITSDPERGMVIEMDGSGDYVTLDERTNLATQTSGNKTIAFWAKPDCKNGDSIVFGSYRNYYVNFFSNGDCSFDMISFCLENDVSSAHCFEWYNSIAQDEWHYYTFVIEIAPSRIEGELFIDGEQVFPNPNAWEETYGNVNNNFYFGTKSDNIGNAEGTSSYYGLLDEFRIYNKILTLEEISSLYSISQR